ncbi:MAG: chromosomal replication initiator protein DnaA [Syntrophobacteraceae bacterium]
MDQEWRRIKDKLSKSLSKGQYDLWVSTIEPKGIEQDRLILGCRNRFHIEWLREKLDNKLLTAARQFFPNLVKIEYKICEESPFERKEEETTLGPRQLNFAEVIKRPATSFNPRFTFDQFVVGNSNQFAYAASMAMARSRQPSNQSVMLLSQTGLGKSHLSHAVGNFLLTQEPDLRVQYLTTEQFANEMIFALKHGNIEAFKNKLRTGCDVLLLERIDFLSGKEKVQSELVYTLDELMDRGKKILCTGNSYPKDIPKLNTELRSRLGGIMAAPIDPPDFKTRIEIIRRKAQIEGTKLPLNVMEFLADQITGDVRRLESCLIGIIAKSNILSIPPSLDLAKDVTQTMLSHLPKITVEHIQQIICSSFQISIDELKSASRKREIAMARKIGMYLCRQYTTESFSSIGKSFERTHSSVLYAVNELGKDIKEKNSKLKRQVEYVSRRLETSCLSV